MKISKKNAGRHIFSLICWGVCTMILSSGGALADPELPSPGGPRCNDLNFSIKFTEKEIDITGMNLGTRFPSFTIENYQSIRCDGSYNNPKERGGFVVVQTRGERMLAMDKRKSQISIADSGGRVGLLAFRTGDGIGLQPVVPGVQDFVLEKKMPGVTEISIQDILGPGINGLMFSAYNLFDWYNVRENGVNVSVSAEPLRLIYRPTCSASVNNVDFGNLNVSDINGVTKQAYVDIDCNDLLLAYSIKVTSDKGSDDNGIFSENDTVGYRLTWGDLNNTGLEPSLSGKQIELNNALDNRNNPTSTRFSIPINITPMSRLSFGNDIKPGKSDSVINIELQFK